MSAPDSLQPRLPARPADGHKGTFGHVLVIGGSRSMPGAPALAGMAAGRSGAGLVTIATASSAHPVTAGFAPWIMTMALPEDSGGQIAESAWEILQPVLQRANVVALGPGLGQSRGLNRLVARLYRELPLPMVVDADGLNALVADETDLRRHAAPRVLTPHPVEMARLVKSTGLSNSTAGIERDQLELHARELASGRQMVIVAKSHETLVTDGVRDWRSSAAPNSGLASGGTGDVLTGLIAGLIAQGEPPLEAAVSAVSLHAQAGQITAQRLGVWSMVATDVLDALPEAFRGLGS